jgi:hypothetical protein
MSIFKSIKDVFIESNEGISTNIPAQTFQQTALPGSVYATPPISGTPPLINNERFINHFDTLFKEANLPGPDYFEWQDMLKALVGLPETTAYTTAFNALRSMGLDKNRLLSSAEAYKAIIDKDATTFEGELSIKGKVDVDAQKAEIENITKANHERMQQIAKLTQEMQEGNVKIQELSISSANNEQKITAVRAMYTQTAEARKQLINEHITKINNYIV